MKNRTLGAWALISLTLIAGCSGKTVAQDIVNWTPTIIATANTVSQTVAALAPQDAVVIAAATAGFDAAAQLLSNQAQTYLNNPNATALQQLQAQVLSFQQNVNAALLQATKITNTESQQKVLAAIQALSVGVTAVLALIASIKGSTVSPATAVKTAQILPLINRGRAVAEIASHYGEPISVASIQYDRTIAQLQAAGL